MPNFSFLEVVILTIPGRWGGVGWVGELRNKTKLQPSSVEVELWQSLAKLQNDRKRINILNHKFNSKTKLEDRLALVCYFAFTAAIDLVGSMYYIPLISRTPIMVRNQSTQFDYK